MQPHFPFPRPPALGEAVQVAPGIRWLRMPLPFALDHINLWLIEDGEGWALIDTGIADDTTRALWTGAFDTALGGRPITRLIATHFHPDHMGLATWLQDRFGVALEASLAEWTTGRMLSLDGGEGARQSSLAFYRGAGAEESVLDTVRKRGNRYADIVAGIPASFKRILPGQDLILGGRPWRVVSGRGHSPDMVCLWCEELSLLISGDQILPSISPNISVWPAEPEGDPLALFLDSLAAFRELPGDLLVLPSHGLPFYGLHGRIDTLAHHHRLRLDETLAAAGRPMSANDMLQVLFKRRLDSHQVFFALGESLAHMHYLAGTGAMVGETGPDGVRRFWAVPGGGTP